MTNKMKGKSFSELLASPPVDDPDYLAEGVKVDFAIALEAQRRIAGVPNKTIAEKLKTSAAYVSKVFRGDVNFTIESMVRLVHAVGGQLHMHIAPSGHKVQWYAVKPFTTSAQIEVSPADISATVLPFRTPAPRLLSQITPAANDYPQSQAG